MTSHELVETVRQLVADFSLDDTGRRIYALAALVALAREWQKEINASDTTDPAAGISPDELPKF